MGIVTIRRAELTASETKLTRVNDQAVRRVLEAAGVEFIDAEGGGPGVRLRRCQVRRVRYSGPRSTSAAGKPRWAAGVEFIDETGEEAVITAR